MVEAYYTLMYIILAILMEQYEYSKEDCVNLYADSFMT